MDSGNTEAAGCQGDGGNGGCCDRLVRAPRRRAYANTNRVEIVIFATNFRADVMWASQQDGQNVFLWPNNSSASQEFDLINMGGGFFQLRARHSDKCLMVDRTQVKVGNGRRIAQYPCTDAGYKSAQSSFQDINGNCEANALCIDSGRRAIKNRYTGKCLDTANPSGTKPGEQAVLQSWTCISSPSAWNAEPDLEDHRSTDQAARHPAQLGEPPGTSSSRRPAMCGPSCRARGRRVGPRSP